jgi:DNA polymerase-4
MPLSLARRKVPRAVFLPENPAQYERFSSHVLEMLYVTAPVVEAASLDDFYLDLTGCRRLYGGDLFGWARRLQEKVRGETRLPLSLGLASNKMLARMATRLAKPRHMVHVLPGMEREFVAPMPVGFLPGIGERIESRLRDFGVRKVGQLACFDEQLLRVVFGSQGSELLRRARGEFCEPVKATALHRFVTHEHRFAEDVADPERLQAAGALLAQKLAGELRTNGLRASVVELTLTYSDAQSSSRKLRLEYPSNHDEDFTLPVCRALLELFTRRVRARSLRLRAPFVPHGDTQFDLFGEQSQQRRNSLYEAIDQVRARHGFMALTSARSILAEPGASKGLSCS